MISGVVYRKGMEGYEVKTIHPATLFELAGLVAFVLLLGLLAALGSGA